jgi:hypothetical protein
MKRSGRIFLCHATEDKAQVKEIYRKLVSDGFAPWLDECDILPGQRWDAEIKRAIRSAALVLVFLSRTSVAKRGYVQKEFKLAVEISQEFPDDQVFVIPLRLDECHVPNLFEHLQWMNYYDSGGYGRLLQAIRIHTALQAEAPKEPLPTEAPRPADTREVVQVSCSNSESCVNGRPILKIPKDMLDDDGLVKGGARGRAYDGFFVSPIGNVYCSGSCWAHYVSD